MHYSYGSFAFSHILCYWYLCKKTFNNNTKYIIILTPSLLSLFACPTDTGVPSVLKVDGDSVLLAGGRLDTGDVVLEVTGRL